MPLTLQSFANGDTNYIPKHNQNMAAIAAAIDNLGAQIQAAAGAAVSEGSAFSALFGIQPALVGVQSYLPTVDGTDLEVAGGYFWRPSNARLSRTVGTTVLAFSGVAAGTYYLQIDSTGSVTRSDTSAEAAYSVVWDGAAFGTITRLAVIVFGAADWIAAQDSTSLGDSYETLDARLEAGEAATVSAGDVVGPAVADDNHLAVFDGITGKLIKDGGVAPTGTNTGDQTNITGNAGTATALQTARTIGGVAFDGTANITQPYDVPTFYPGIPTASAVLYRGKVARAVVAPANFAGAQFTGTANATASTVFDVQKNAVSCGSCTIAPGTLTPTFATTGGAVVNFAAGDVLAVIAPATPDVTLADPAITFAFTR